MKQYKIMIVKNQLVALVLLFLTVPMVSVLAMEVRETRVNKNETTSQALQPRTWLGFAADGVRSFMAAHSDPVSASHSDSSALQSHQDEQSKPAQVAANIQESSITFMNQPQEQVVNQSSVPLKTLVAPVPRRVGFVSLLDLNENVSGKNRPISQLSIRRPITVARPVETVITEQSDGVLDVNSEDKQSGVDEKAIEKDQVVVSAPKRIERASVLGLNENVSGKKRSISQISIFGPTHTKKYKDTTQQLQNDANKDQDNNVQVVQAHPVELTPRLARQLQSQAASLSLTVPLEESVANHNLLLNQEKELVASSVGSEAIVEPVVSLELLTNKEEQLVDSIVQDSQSEVDVIMHSSPASQSAQLNRLFVNIGQSIISTSHVDLKMQNSPEFKQEVEAAVAEATQATIALTQNKSHVTLSEIFGVFIAKIKKLISYLSGKNKNVMSNKQLDVVKDHTLSQQSENNAMSLEDVAIYKQANVASLILTDPSIGSHDTSPSEQDLMRAHDINVLKLHEPHEIALVNNVAESKVINNNIVADEAVAENINPTTVIRDIDSAAKDLQGEVGVMPQEEIKPINSAMSPQEQQAHKDIANILVDFINPDNKEHASVYLDKIKDIITANPNLELPEKRFMELFNTLDQNRNRFDLSGRGWTGPVTYAQNTVYWAAKMVSDPVVNKGERILMNILNSVPDTKVQAPDGKEWKRTDIKILNVIAIKGDPALQGVKS